MSRPIFVTIEFKEVLLAALTGSAVDPHSSFSAKCIAQSAFAIADEVMIGLAERATTADADPNMAGKVSP